MLPELSSYIDTLSDPITERKSVLDTIAHAVNPSHHGALIFVCTHNSRRSQMCEIWSKVFASHHKLDLNLASAGTEETALNIRTVNALRRCGMEIDASSDIDRNPHYLIRHSENKSRLDAWSKTLDDQSLELDDSIVVMTCSHADQNCPHIPEAKQRISLTYTDPKGKDGTEMEDEAYDTACRIIASEMRYLIEKIATAR